MTPAVLVDLTLDGIDDIVVATFGGLVVAFDGRFFTQLWNATFPGCETYSSPAVGFFDDDDVPDVLVKYQHGHDYQNYDSEQVRMSNLESRLEGMQRLHQLFDADGGSQREEWNKD